MILLALSTHAHSVVVFHDSKAALDAVRPTQVIDNFEQELNQAFPRQFQRGSLHFTSHAGVPVIIGSRSTYYNFGSNLNPFRGTVLTASGDEDYTIKFLDSPKYAAGFDLILNGLGPARVDVLNQGQVVGSLNIANIPGGGYRYVGFSSNTAFDSFRWVTTAGGSLNTAIDNIAVHSIPEAQTWGMLVAGLAGLAFMRRRQHNKLEP
ncbi:hypothetical protein V8J88_12550 [Massilia sp. W12]|uniref:hypothetical protein n=1 Tax=Massilia sp. W12 TaxID=3126507 RepID=UPI0030CABC1D